jgi:hypothetical protein
MDTSRGIIDILQDGTCTAPPVLYKYAAFGKWTPSIFECNELYLSSPESFNDPFDSKIRFIYEGTRTDKKRFIREHWRHYAPNESRKIGLNIEKRALRNEGKFLEGIQRMSRSQLKVWWLLLTETLGDLLLGGKVFFFVEFL